MKENIENRAYTLNSKVVDTLIEENKGEEEIFKKPYVKPTLEKQEKMTFPFDVINTLNNEISCRQCSSCHGCR